MGTSTARKAPRGGLWRQAKGAAYRFLSPKECAPPSSQEVVRRYLTALDASHGGTGVLPAFVLTRRAAQELGHFWESRQAEVISSEIQVQLYPHALANRWLPWDGSLEAATSRTALVAVCQEAMLPGQHYTQDLEAAMLVRRYLARAVGTRLFLDLGEALEAAATDAARLASGQAALQAVVAEALGQPPAPPPGTWLKLPGWVHVTQVLAGLAAFLTPEANP